MPEASGSPGGEGSRAGVKDWIEKFGLTEVLGYIFPGVIVLCAWPVWAKPDLEKAFGSSLAGSGLVISLVFLILAYAIGHIVSMWSLRGVEPIARPVWTGEALRAPWHLCKLIGWRSYCWAVGLPEFLPSGLCLDLSDALTGFLSQDYMILLQRVNEQMSVFRVLAADRLKDNAVSMLAEAEIVRRRILFSLGVALALLLFAASAFARLAVTLYVQWGRWQVDWIRKLDKANDVPIALLIVIIFISLYASKKLRRVAAHCREHELILTLAIMKRLDEAAREAAIGSAPVWASFP